LKSRGTFLLPVCVVRGITLFGLTPRGDRVRAVLTGGSRPISLDVVEVPGALPRVGWCDSSNGGHASGDLGSAPYFRRDRRRRGSSDTRVEGEPDVVCLLCRRRVGQRGGRSRSYRLLLGSDRRSDSSPEPTASASPTSSSPIPTPRLVLTSMAVQSAARDLRRLSRSFQLAFCRPRRSAPPKSVREIS